MKNLFRQHGILGINARNYLYIRPFNKKKAVRLADDKLKTKQFLSTRGVPVPRLFAVIRNHEELERFDFSALPNEFVLKPNLGFGGEGIIPFIGREGEKFVRSSGKTMDLAELKETINDILEGRFSISGTSDIAFFEQMMVCDESLAKFAYKGLPDIRVVVHNLIPVMAMLRLPTKESDGRANLHQGALGVGIDIARGTATHIVYKNKIIDEVPEVGAIRGVKIPYWDDILMIASQVQLVTNLGYLAADIVIDKNVGPVLLEINARAGLSVQLANLAPLRRRLERIAGVKVTNPEKGVRIAQDMFGNKIEKEVKKVSGKAVISHMEQVQILGSVASDETLVLARINPLLEHTVVDEKLAKKLELAETEGENVKIKFTLDDQRIQTLAHKEDLSEHPFDMIVGRRDLIDFLIDPTKDSPLDAQKLPTFDKIEAPVSVHKGPNFQEIDRKLIAIDREVKLLHHLRPLNLRQEQEVFAKDPSYNPQFIYPEPKFDLLHAKERLRAVKKELDDSPLGELFHRKLKEIRHKVELIEGVGSDSFTDYSKRLYGLPSKHLIKEAQKKLDSKPKAFDEVKEYFDLDYSIAEFEKIFKSYGLEGWRVKVKKDMVADCLAGKNSALLVREGAVFDKDRLRMLIAHEIETHVLTAENGKRQTYLMFNRGFGDYLETQEGLAVWNQESILNHDVAKNYRAAMLVFLVEFASKHSFAELVDYALKLGVSPDRAFRTALKVKRGMEDTSKPGCFSKDMVYFSGYLQVKDFVKKGSDIKELYYGKYNLRDLELIKKVPHLKEPFLLPHFLR